MIYLLIAVIVISFVSGILFFFGKSGGPRRQDLRVPPILDRSTHQAGAETHEVLQSISGLILGYAGAPEVFDALSRSLGEGLDFQHVWIDLFNPERGRFEIKGVYEPIPGLDESDRDLDLTKEAIQTGKTFYFTSLEKQADGRLAVYKRLGLSSLLVIPLGTRDRNWGTLNLADPRERPLSKRDMENLQLISDIFSLSVEHRWSRASLLEKEAHHRTLINTVPDGIVTIDERGTILSVNQAFEDLFGYFSDEIIGRNITGIIPDDRVNAHTRAIDAYLKTGHRKIIGLTRELEAVKRGGERFPIGLTVGDVMIGGGHFFVGAIRDMTDRIKDRSKLQSARHLARKAIRARTQTLTELAYQCQTPLARIRDRAHQLLNARLGPDQREHVKSINAASEALIRNLDSVLEITKIQSGKWTRDTASFDLSLCLEGLGDLLAETAGEKGLDLVLQIEPNIQVESDEKQFRQAIATFVRYAVRKTKRPGIVLRCVRTKQDERTVMVRIEIRSNDPDDESSSDTSPSVSPRRTPGMDSEDIARDMVLAQLLIEMMGGKVGDLGRDQTRPFFRIDMNMKRSDPERDHSGPALKGVRFLIAEDRPEVREAFSLMLTAAGATLRWTETVEAQIPLIDEAGPFDFLVLSLKALDAATDKILDRIRSESSSNRTAILILCKASSRGRALALLERGADFCLVEPVTQRRLMNAIDSCVRESTAGGRDGK